MNDLKIMKILQQRLLRQGAGRGQKRSFNKGYHLVVVFTNNFGNNY
jgi:hypothetical protein